MPEDIQYSSCSMKSGWLRGDSDTICSQFVVSHWKSRPACLWARARSMAQIEKRAQDIILAPAQGCSLDKGGGMHMQRCATVRLAHTSTSFRRHRYAQPVKLDLCFHLHLAVFCRPKPLGCIVPSPPLVPPPPPEADSPPPPPPPPEGWLPNDAPTHPLPREPYYHRTHAKLQRKEEITKHPTMRARAGAPVERMNITLIPGVNMVMCYQVPFQRVIQSVLPKYGGYKW